MVRIVYGLPNTAHTYFIEHVSKSKHIKTSLLLRYLKFVKALKNSQKKCLVNLVNRSLNDNGSITRQNINFIETESDIDNVLQASLNTVSDNIVYREVPDGDEWRLDFLEELIMIRDKELGLEGGNFSRAEIIELIFVVCTS